MVQRGGRARFLLEARDTLGRGHVGRQDLDRDRTMQPRVLGAVDFAHAAGAEERLEHVGTQAGARGQ